MKTVVFKGDEAEATAKEMLQVILYELATAQSFVVAFRRSGGRGAGGHCYGDLGECRVLLKVIGDELNLPKHREDLQ